MAASFDIRKVDNMTKLAVNGYAREHGMESNVRIPMEIQCVILHFYWIAEKFTLHGQNIKLNEESTVATMVNWDETGDLKKYNTVYGDNAIHLEDENVSVYKWTFKILHGATRYNQPITIGIDSSTNSEFIILNADFADDKVNQDKFYGVSVSGWKFNWSGFGSIDEMGDDLADGDILVMILNVDERKLWCKSKGKMHCIAENVEVKDVKYNMAVSMSREHDSVQLLSFEKEIK